MAKNYYAIFDNLSVIKPNQSDILASSITGTSGSKRKLYSDDELIIYKFKICVGMNGINIVANRPDLIERSINFEEGKAAIYCSDTSFWELFDNKKGSILGGIFNAVSGAMKIKHTIKTSGEFRMVDWLEWGCAIAKSIGYDEKEFIDSYKISCSKLNEDLLQSNPIAKMIIKFMESRIEWEGNMEKLLTELNMIGSLLGFDKYSKGYPQSPIDLGKQFNEIKHNLKHYGIIKVDTNLSERRFKLVNLNKIERPPWSKFSCYDESGEQTKHCTDCGNHGEMLKYQESKKPKPQKCRICEKEKLEYVALAGGGFLCKECDDKLKKLIICSRCGNETTHYSVEDGKIICNNCEPMPEIPEEQPEPIFDDSGNEILQIPDEIF